MMVNKQFLCQIENTGLFYFYFGAADVRIF